MQVNDFVKKVHSGELDPVENIKKVLAQVNKINSEYNYFNVISEEVALKQAEQVRENLKNNILGKFAGVPVSVKDCLCVKGVESTAGSAILKGYKPVFHATAVQKLVSEGAIIIGKTTQDEFGHGSFTTNIGKGMMVPLNPFDKERACGGSSGGSGGISQMADFAHMSLGESTGGSIVAPASFCGVYGLCPTYGRVSRYGLMDYANSLDKIGPMGKSIHDIAASLQTIAGFDNKESTTIKEPVPDYVSWLANSDRDIKNLKIGVIKECLSVGVSDVVKKSVWAGIKKLESLGVKYEEVSLPLVSKYGVETYYLIAMSETSTNLAKYCGMRYGAHDKLTGNFNEYFSRVREANFGTESKRRIIIGTFARMAGYRDAYYLKAMKVRTKIINEYKSAFKKFNALACPTMPVLPPKFTEISKLTPLENYMMDIMTVGPNLAGLPHLNVPVEKQNGLPVGMQLIGDHLNEKTLLEIGQAMDK